MAYNREAAQPSPMAEAWLRAECPGCGEQWEAAPSELPPPGHEVDCPHCGATDVVQAFMATERSLDVLEEFHA